MIHQGDLEITKENADKYRNLTEVTGNLNICAGAALDALATVGGNLVVYVGTRLEAPQLTTIGGNVVVYAGAALDAPRLTAIGGSLYVYVGAAIDVPQLTTVGGNLVVYVGTRLEAPQLTTIGGNVVVYAGAAIDVPQLTAIGGSLYVYVGAAIDVPQLTTVGGSVSVIGGSVSVDAGAALDAPRLTAIGGSLYVYVGAALDAPQLATVGGSVYVYAEATLGALTTVGGNLCVYAEAPLNVPQAKDRQKEAWQICSDKLRMAFAKEGLIKADGILSWIISEETQKDATIYKIQIVGKTNQSYLALKNDVFAHGETKDEALLDLDFKTDSRDKSQYKSWAIDEQKPMLEMVRCYRAITGACRSGVKKFIDQLKDKKETYSVKEVILITKGHFGHEEFMEFFG